MKTVKYTISFTESQLQAIKFLVNGWYPDTKEDNETKVDLLNLTKILNIRK